MRPRAVGARQDRGEENQEREWASEWPIQEAKDRARVMEREKRRERRRRGEARRRESFVVEIDADGLGGVGSASKLEGRRKARREEGLGSTYI
jgi:hypothetical protein